MRRPNRPARQFWKRAQPVARLQETVEDFVGAGSRLGDHGGAPTGMKRAEPRGASQRFTAILIALQKVAAEIAVTEDACGGTATRLFCQALSQVNP